jgi:hypothetical protein
MEKPHMFNPLNKAGIFSHLLILLTVEKAAVGHMLGSFFFFSALQPDGDIVSSAACLVTFCHTVLFLSTWLKSYRPHTGLFMFYIVVG